MYKNDIFSIAGYFLSLIIFLITVLFSMINFETGKILTLILGGSLLFITSIYKTIFINKKIN